MNVVEALTVTLGLDPKGFIKGAKDSTVALGKTKDETVKSGKAIEKSLDGASEAVDRLARNALKLFAIFTAGRAVKDFAADITSADSALGRLAARVGSTPEAISGLANAVARGGGSADAAANSFQRFSDAVNELRTTGSSSIMAPLAKMQALSGQTIRLNADAITRFGDLADAAKGTADKAGAPMANFLLRQAGIDQDTAALLIQGRAKLMAELAKSGKLGLVRKEDAEAAQKLQTSIETLRQTSENFGRTIMTKVTPVIVDLIERFQRWIEANKEWIQSDIITKLEEFATALRKFPWDDTAKGIKDFITDANAAAQAVGGWKTVVESLFALWLGSKFLNVLKAIGLLRVALTGGKLTGGLISALGLLGTAEIAALLGTSVATDKGTPNAEKPGVITRSDDENTGAAVRPSEGHYDGGIGHDRGVVREYARRAWRGVKRMFGGGSADAAEGHDDGIHRRARQTVIGRAQQNANSAAVMEEFKAAGLPAEGVAALMGSAQTESSFNPRAHNNVSGGHTGLLQWDKNRWPKIKSWIESQRDENGQPGNPYDARWQARAAVAEGRAKPGDPLYDHPRTERGWKALEGSAGNLGKALDGIRDIERYGAGEEGKRGAYAQSWLPHVNGTATASTAPAQGTPAGVTDISQQATYNHGQLDAVKGFIVHHAGMRGTPEDVVNVLNRRRLGVQYVMDREGKVFQTLPPGARGAHIRPAENGSGLNNSNALGMEVIAKDDRDVTPAQVAAAKQFIAQLQKQYPGMQVYGHGEINGHKQETEGKTIVDAVRRAPQEAPVAAAAPPAPAAAAAPAAPAAKAADAAPPAKAAEASPPAPAAKTVPASQVAPIAKAAPAAEPPKPSAWNGIPAAFAFADQVRSAQAANISRISNDNRSTTSNDNSSETHFHGDFNIQTAATDGPGLMADLRQSLSRRTLAMSVNTGQA